MRMFVPTLTGINIRSEIFPFAALAFQSMWGHAATCGCSLCFCFPRLFGLVREGSSYPGFVVSAGLRLRVAEAELRDELTRLQAVALGPPPPATGPPRESPGLSQAPPPEPAAAPPPLPEPRGLTPKAPPANPPSEAAAPEEACPSKLEKKEPTPEASPRKAAVEEVEESKPAVPSSLHVDRPKKKRKSKSGKKAKRRSRSSRSRKRRREERRSGERGERRSPNRESSRGRERKRRSERPPEPAYPPRGYSNWGPREPWYPPPAERGSGWRGPLPVSDHPRWTEGTNKGLTKRAKQEVHNRRHGRR